MVINTMHVVCVLVIFVTIVSCQRFYDTFTGKEISPANYAELQRVNLIPFCAVSVQECQYHEPRRYDGSCNNLHEPSRGTILTPYRRLLPPEFGPGYTLKNSDSGKPLPLGRSVRTSLMPDGRVEDKNFTNLFVYMIVLTTGESTTVHDTANYVFITRSCCNIGDVNPKCMPIIIPPDDIHLRYSDVRCMNLTRAITYQDLGCVPSSVPPERFNLATPSLDNSALYGVNSAASERVRENRGGRLKTDIVNGREWPPDGATVCFQNQLPRETRCHSTANIGINSIIGVNVMTIWFYRAHNFIARQLEALNPCWDDDRLFREAREINTAYINQILYYELMVNVMGPEFLLKNKAIYDTYGHIDDYNKDLAPSVTLEYVLALRWFHSMQEGRMKMYDNKGRIVDELKVTELTLRTGLLPLNKTLEKMTQSMFRQPTAAADYLIDPEIGERILGNIQLASDIMSIDIMRNRDFGLPPYYKYRKICGLPVPDDFDDLLHWMPVERVDALRTTYDRVQDVDLMAGIIGEKFMPGATVGPTLACIMVDQLRYWRQSDRFWYENSVHPGAFTEEQLKEIRKMTQARLICDYGDEVDAIQPNPYRLPGKGNDIIDCEYIPPHPGFLPWMDLSCEAKNISSDGNHSSSKG